MKSNFSSIAGIFRYLSSVSAAIRERDAVSCRTVVVDRKHDEIFSEISRYGFTQIGVEGSSRIVVTHPTTPDVVYKLELFKNSRNGSACGREGVFWDNATETLRGLIAEVLMYNDSVTVMKKVNGTVKAECYDTMLQSEIDIIPSALKYHNGFVSDTHDENFILCEDTNKFIMIDFGGWAK